jgi:hypothetical protein
MSSLRNLLGQALGEEISVDGSLGKIAPAKASRQARKQLGFGGSLLTHSVRWGR